MDEGSGDEGWKEVELYYCQGAVQDSGYGGFAPGNMANRQNAMIQIMDVYDVTADSRDIHPRTIPWI